MFLGAVLLTRSNRMRRTLLQFTHTLSCALDCPRACSPRATSRPGVSRTRCRLLHKTALKRISQRCGFGSEETMRRSFLRVLAVANCGPAWRGPPIPQIVAHEERPSKIINFEVMRRPNRLGRQRNSEAMQSTREFSRMSANARGKRCRSLPLLPRLRYRVL